MARDYLHAVRAEGSRGTALGGLALFEVLRTHDTARVVRLVGIVLGAICLVILVVGIALRTMTSVQVDDDNITVRNPAHGHATIPRAHLTSIVSARIRKPGWRGRYSAFSPRIIFTGTDDKACASLPGWGWDPSRLRVIVLGDHNNRVLWKVIDKREIMVRWPSAAGFYIRATNGQIAALVLPPLIIGALVLQAMGLGVSR